MTINTAIASVLATALVVSCEQQAKPIDPLRPITLCRILGTSERVAFDGSRPTTKVSTSISGHTIRAVNLFTKETVQLKLSENLTCKSLTLAEWANQQRDQRAE